MKRGGNKETRKMLPNYLLMNFSEASWLEQVVHAWLWFLHIVERHENARKLIYHPVPAPGVPFGRDRKVAYETALQNPPGDSSYKRKIVAQVVLGEDYKSGPSFEVTIVDGERAHFNFMKLVFRPDRNRSRWEFSYRARADSWVAKVMTVGPGTEVVDFARMLSKKDRDKTFVIFLNELVNV